MTRKVSIPVLFLLRVAICAALLLMVPVMARADSAYIATASGSFGILDFGSHTYTASGTTSALYSGLAFGPSNNLYTVEGSSGRFFMVNPGTGSGTVVGSGTSVKNWVMGGLTTGALYEVDFNSNIISLNPATGAGTVVGSTGLPVPSGTDAAGLTGNGTTLYYAFNDPSLTDTKSILYAINPASCCTPQKIGTDTGLGAIGALAFVNGTLYGFDNVAKNVVTIDTTTGVATVVFPFPGLLATDRVVGAVDATGAATNAKILPQFAVGGGWFSALYFTNTGSTSVSFPVNFVSDSGTPLVIPSLGGSSTTVSLQPRGTAAVLTTNPGSLSQGYASMSLPAGVVGYGLFDFTATGIPDQEAVVPLSSASTTTSTLIWDDTNNFVTAVAIVNPSNVATTITITLRDTTGATLATSAVFLQPKSKTEAVLRTLPGLAGMAGNRGSADFTATSGNVAVIGLRFIGYAFTSIATADK
jgi:hypothetical protein